MKGNMHISDDGLALIKRFEGFSATPYLCPAGRRTIGYGHTIDKKEEFKGGLTHSMAESLLKQDVSRAEAAIARLVTVPLTQRQWDALVSLIYNIGTQAFEKSSLLMLLNQEDTERAAGEFKRWVYSKGRKLPGLIARRRAESQLFQQKA